MKLPLRLTTQSVAVALWATRHERVKRMSRCASHREAATASSDCSHFHSNSDRVLRVPDQRGHSARGPPHHARQQSRHTRGQSRSGASCRAAPGLSLHRLARFRRARPRRCSVWPPGRRERSKRICCGSRQFGTDVVQHGCAAFASAWRH